MRAGVDPGGGRAGAQERVDEDQGFVRAASPVVVCYAAGMLLGNLPFVDFPDEVSLNVCNITVALAIPLLLFSVNIASWMRLAGKTVLASSMAMVAAVTGAAVAYTVCSDWLAESPKIAGMLVGVYVGGTPNMAAIGTAVHVESETFILLNAADMVVSFGYLLFILTIAPRVLARFLPAFQKQAPGRSDADGGSLSQRPTPASAGVAILAAMVIVATAILAARAVPEGARDAVIILIITTLAVVASTVPTVRNLAGTHDMGQFLLLVFCVAMGFTTDFVKLFSASPAIIAFAGITVSLAVGLHFVLSAAFRVDRDTAIITSTAAIFGPHMVGPVVVALKNREVLFSGLASGLVGYAAGNYLGMGVVWVLS